MYKKIGVGWQFNVYQISNERVLKTSKSWFSQFLIILFSAGPFIFFKKRPIQQVRKDARTSLFNLNKILNNPNFPNDTIGNPLIDVKNFSYSQDLVEPFSSYLKRASDFERKRALSLFPKLIKSLWNFGFSEKVFNFKLNLGIDKSGELVLTDLGELDFEKENVVSSINSRRWIRAHDCRSMQDKELKSFYIDLMDSELTVQELEKNWKIKVV